jgi:hypothetical protein
MVKGDAQGLPPDLPAGLTREDLCFPALQDLALPGDCLEESLQGAIRLKAGGELAIFRGVLEPGEGINGRGEFDLVALFGLGVRLQSGRCRAEGFDEALKGDEVHCGTYCITGLVHPEEPETQERR